VSPGAKDIRKPFRGDRKTAMFMEQGGWKTDEAL